MRNLTDAPQCVRNGITRHYSRPNGQLTREDANVRRLRAISRLFGIGPSAIAKAGGVSQPYVSRILSETDPLNGSASFYRKLEINLGTLIGSRQTQFFRVSPSPVRRIENAVEQASL
jgi:transcriptional regulator with XRE-family HTH domain